MFCRLRRRSCKAVKPLRRKSPRHAETVAGVAADRVAEDADGRPNNLCGEVERTAAHHAVCTISRSRWVSHESRWVRGSIPIAAPLPHISVHVIQTPWVGLLLAHDVSRTAVPRIICESLLPETPYRRRTSTAGIFPFGLSRQTIAATAKDRNRFTIDFVIKFQVFRLAQFVAKRNCFCTKTVQIIRVIEIVN